MKLNWIAVGLIVAGFLPNICLAQTTQPTQPSAQQVASQLLSSVPTDKPHVNPTLNGTCTAAAGPRLCWLNAASTAAKTG